MTQVFAQRVIISRGQTKDLELEVNVVADDVQTEKAKKF
jgi:hypothetical protein